MKKTKPTRPIERPFRRSWKTFKVKSKKFWKINEPYNKSLDFFIEKLALVRPIRITQYKGFIMGVGVFSIFVLPFDKEVEVIFAIVKTPRTKQLFCAYNDHLYRLGRIDERTNCIALFSKLPNDVVKWILTFLKEDPRQTKLAILG